MIGFSQRHVLDSNINARQVSGWLSNLGTFEAVMCSSILLLNKNSEPYRKVCRDGKYCKLVELSAEDIA